MIYFERYDTYRFGDISQDIYLALGKDAHRTSDKELLSLFRTTLDISPGDRVEIVRDKSVEIVVEYQKEKELASA